MRNDLTTRNHTCCVCCRTCHTTREPYFGEEDGRDYHFVQNEEFQNMIRMVRLEFGG